MLAAAYLFPRSDEEGSSMQRKRASSNSVSLVCMRSSWWSRAKAPAVPVQGLFCSFCGVFLLEELWRSPLVFVCLIENARGVYNKATFFAENEHAQPCGGYGSAWKRARSEPSLCCVHSRSRVTDEPDLIYCCTVDTVRSEEASRAVGGFRFHSLENSSDLSSGRDLTRSILLREDRSFYRALPWRRGKRIMNEHKKKLLYVRSSPHVCRVARFWSIYINYTIILLIFSYHTVPCKSGFCPHDAF